MNPRSVSSFLAVFRSDSGYFLRFRLDKGVIVYICDGRGVRDIYDTDGSSAIAASEPLVVLVCQFTEPSRP